MLMKTALDILWETPMPPLLDLASPLPTEPVAPPAEAEPGPHLAQSSRTFLRLLRRKQTGAAVASAKEIEEIPC